MGGVVGAKRLELLRLLVPKAMKIGMLVSPNYPDTEAEREDVKAGTQRTTRLIILEIRDGDELDGAFAALIARKRSISFTASPGLLICLARARARAAAGTSSVMTDPAARGNTYSTGSSTVMMR